MEKFENKIIDMRDMYEDRKEKGLPMMVEEPAEPVLYPLVCVVLAVAAAWLFCCLGAFDMAWQCGESASIFH